VILLAVRWYLWLGLSYPDLDEIVWQAIEADVTARGVPETVDIRSSAPTRRPG
jgi:hypothetical protein